ncbi:hypothetical protein A3C96_02690 [Candidatus Uhrbacteria bacterium RIFCSPHIGHO2_02_FULL_60_10]|uniref:ABC transporter domain-containing protein n=1 Tax=Candidatus Uhrbacteria bacterium RIFCSPHIGHO2_02_FULL_60_10 TaxID=1802392 RepID=A0A1F7U6Q1_9BACT|nr:MAG: hypothetical protein A3C96_02690 [Candidatus Uhrbacteria bacterium RIFCSPHIGHO2_02_FULL_60_10]
MPAISVQNVSVDLGGVHVLEDLTFAIPQGDVVAILGPNGSGKTTLLKAMLGLIPFHGEIRIFGKHLHAVRELIAYVPQRFDFDREFPITVGEYMDLARHRHTPPDRIASRLAEVGLPATLLDQRLGSLSGGQMQRVLIAQALLNNPLVLFLDEPAANIDISGEATFTGILKDLSKRQDVTVVMVTHDISMVTGLVDHVLCLDGRMLCFGRTNQVLTEKKINEVFRGDSAGRSH